jgi:RND family efflux transporter MFP subunit
MKSFAQKLAVFIVVMILTLLWILYFHNDAVAGALPKWGWLQSTVTALRQRVPEVPAEDDDPDNTKNEIPVHTAHVSTATLHRYVEGFGTIAPRPAKQGEMAGSATISSPVAGVVAKVLCQIGQQVKAGDPLIQLDDRLARSAEDQASAALAQAQASLAELQATPRPEQLQISQAAVDQKKAALDFAQQTYDRLMKLEAQESAKAIQQATVDVATAKNDLETAQKQLALLKPTPEEMTQEQAKVAQAAAALATARVQREMMTITSPIDATVVSLPINPGEAVDTTKTVVQLIAMDRLIVDVDIPADQLPANAVGLAALIQTTNSSADSDNAITAKVAFVSPEVDAHNGAVMVGIDLPPDAALRPGLNVRVRIVAEEHKDCLVVPREAVVADENGDSVIAIVGKEEKTNADTATHKTVKVGLEENGQIEIIADGIKEGDTVVTAGAYGLPQATHIKILD